MNTGFRTLAPQHVKRAVIDSSDTTIAVASGRANNRINVLGLSLSASGAGKVMLKSDETDKLPNTFKATDPAWVLHLSPDSWVECGLGEDLDITNPTGLTITGVVVYVELGDKR